jgi:hypothetical protein
MPTFSQMRAGWELERFLGINGPPMSGPCDKTLEGKFNISGPCDKTLEYPIPRRIPKPHRYGETLICLQCEINKETGLPLYPNAPASCWKPPEKRSSYDSCPWPRSRY